MLAEDSTVRKLEGSGLKDNIHRYSYHAEYNPSLRSTCKDRAFSLAKTDNPNQVVKPPLIQMLNSGQNLELDHSQE